MRVIESGVGELIQAPDVESFREWNRTQKSRTLIDKRMSEAEAVQRFVYDGCYRHRALRHLPRADDTGPRGGPPGQ